jgi:hypothetical protein
MRNNRKLLGIIIIILGLLILGLFIYLFFFNQEEAPKVTEDDQKPPLSGQLPDDEEAEKEPDITTGDKPRNYQEYDISQEEEHEINEKDLIKIAQSFAERFGSYSNYSNYSNFSDLKIFMTNKMKSWAENYVSDLKLSSQGSNEYFGVTTRAVFSKIKEYNEAASRAVIIVSTNRRESTGQVNEGQAYNQDIEITLKKSGGSWLVDSAYWQ